MSTMIRVLVRTSFVLLVLNQLLTPCEAWGSYGGRGGGKYGKGNNEPGKPSIGSSLGGSSSAFPNSNSPKRGIGISAWGIVILVVSLILAGMGFYYFSMCYPAFCIKKNKYDMMGLPSVA